MTRIYIVAILPALFALAALGHAAKADSFRILDSARWIRLNPAAIDVGGTLYTSRELPGRRYVFTHSFYIPPDFSLQYGTHLDDIESARKNFLGLFGFSKYHFISHQSRPAGIRGFTTRDELQIQYRDHRGKNHIATERQYLFRNQAYVVTYIEEIPSASNSDLNRIEKTLDLFQPVVPTTALKKFGIMNFLLFSMDEVWAEEAVTGTEMVENESGAQAAKICGKGAWQGAKKMGKDVVNAAYTLNTGGQLKMGAHVVSGLGTLIAAFYNDPKGTAGALANGVYDEAQKYVDKAKRTLGDPEKTLEIVCEQLPGFLSAGLVGKLAQPGTAAAKEAAEKIEARLAEAAKGGAAKGDAAEAAAKGATPNSAGAASAAASAVEKAPDYLNDPKAMNSLQLDVPGWRTQPEYSHQMMEAAIDEAGTMDKYLGKEYPEDQTMHFALSDLTAARANVEEATGGKVPLSFYVHRLDSPIDADSATTFINKKYQSFLPDAIKASEDPAYLKSREVDVDGQKIHVTYVRKNVRGGSAPDYDWVHPKLSDEVVIERHANKLLRNLLTSHGTPQQTLRKIAEIHWWMANAEPLVQGSAAVNDALAKSLMVRFHLSIRPWAKGIAPDIEAFHMSLQKYMDSNPSFFGQ